MVEIISELGVQMYAGRRDLPKTGPLLAFLGYMAAGAIAGAVSLGIFPQLFINSPSLRIANLVLTPLLTAAVMALLGGWRLKRGEMLLRLDRFGYAYIFALCMALVRYFFTHSI